MPPTAGWWKYFKKDVPNKTANCKIDGCPRPTITLTFSGRDKKKIGELSSIIYSWTYLKTVLFPLLTPSNPGTATPTGHLKNNHPDVWKDYADNKKEVETVAEAKKKEVQAGCEMESGETRNSNMRSKTGQESFLLQVTLWHLAIKILPTCVLMVCRPKTRCPLISFPICALVSQ